MVAKPAVKISKPIARKLDVLDMLAMHRLVESKCDVRALVEGKRDLESMRALGFTRVEELDGALYEVVERYEKGETVQLLMDLDSEGVKLYKRLRADFTQRGVRIDDDIRSALFATPVRHIEGLSGWIARRDSK